MSERGHDAQRRGAHRVASSIDRRLSWASLAAGLFGDEAAPVPVGPYLLCRELGRGSSGTVYLARDPVLQRDVALKLLHPGHGSPAAMLQEARALARLSAPNIVSVYGVGEHEGLVYIAMALAPGPTLRQWQAQAHRTPDDVLAAYRQAGLGLQAAHEQGICHRDFKPDNVRVGDDGRALVLDFGFAGAVEGSTSGTPAYMAPEQMLARAGDARADQFSFCVALYEGLFGQRPFEAEAGPARLDEIRAGRVRRPPADSSLPREIVEVLRQGLAYDPQSRHASMRELLDALLVAAASSPQQRARRILLTRVEAFWIDGVLRAALGGEPPLPLELSTQPAPSHDPWRERPPQDRAAAPAGEPTSVARALERAPECLVLLGAAGAGKTTLLLQHAASLVRHAREREDAPLPIVLSLSSWDEHTAIEDWLGAELQARYGIPPGFSRAWIDEDRMTLLLDGLDVLAQSRRAACIAALERWCARSLHAAVITSRPPSEATAAWPTGAAVVAIQPLSLHALERALASEPSLQALRAAIDGDPALTDLARNPLALSLLRAIHRETQASGAAPRARAQLWQAYVQRMLDRGGARTGASAKTTRRTLGFVARRMCLERRSELWIEELQPSWLERRWLRALHGTSSLLCVALGSALLTGCFMSATVGIAGGLWSAALTACVAAAFVAIVAGASRIEPVYRLVWSWPHWRRGLRRAIGRAGVGAVGVAAVAAAVWGAAAGPAFGLAVFGVQLGLWFTLLCLVFATLAGLRADDLGDRVRPNLGLLRSLENFGRVFALVVLVVGGVQTMLTVLAPAGADPTTSALISDAARDSPALGAMTELWRRDPVRFQWIGVIGSTLSVAYLAGVLVGGYAVVQHATLRLLLWASGRLPLRLVTVLDDAVRRGLMRRIGGGYLFVHRTLQDELAG